MAAALQVLGGMPAPGRKIAVLGAMRELGPGSDEFHAALADSVLASGASHALLVGMEMAALANALGDSLTVQHLPDTSAAEKTLERLLAPGDEIGRASIRERVCQYG